MRSGQDEAESLAAAYTAAWNSHDPQKVAGCFAGTGWISVNSGDAWRGRDGVAQMAAGFFAELPDLALTCDAVRAAGRHAAFLWTFQGTHTGSGRKMSVSGWDEWDLDEAGLIAAARSWFDMRELSAPPEAG